MGCKLTKSTKKSLKFTQPVIIQSFKDKFELPKRLISVSAKSCDVLALLPQRRERNKEKGFGFRISGNFDSDYAKQPEDRKSISGTIVYLEEASVMFKSATKNTLPCQSLEQICMLK